jgi:transcriptional regulator
MGTISSRSDTGDLLQGTLAILILKALLAGDAHGYGVARWIEETTGDVLRIEEGSLYPALRRLEDRGWVTSEWGLSENNRRARYYSITRAGRAHLRAEAGTWLRYAGAVTRVLRTSPSVT